MGKQKGIGNPKSETILTHTNTHTYTHMHSLPHTHTHRHTLTRQIKILLKVYGRNYTVYILYSLCRRTRTSKDPAY